MKKIFFNLILLCTFIAVINTPVFANTATQDGPFKSLEKKLEQAEKTEPVEENNLSIISLINRNSNYVVGVLAVTILVIALYPNKNKKK